MTSDHVRRLVFSSFALLGVLFAWDASNLDMVLAHWFGNAHGFALTDNWLLSQGLHDGGRLAAWALVTVLAIGVWWPFGWLRDLQQRDRVQLVLSALVSVLAISVLKSFSLTSCPWDLADFGGTARHVSHWVWLRDGGSGHCFPAGHASSGFAFLGGYFVLRGSSATRARWWLGASLAAGLVLGLAQQMRGAHFMSHTLWTGWLCWVMAFAMDLAMRRPAGAAPTPAPVPVASAQPGDERSIHPATARDPSPS